MARIIRAAGLDLRIQLTPRDDHDEVMAAYEASLPERTRNARRKRDLAAINKARRTRGLEPVGEGDLVGAGERG